MARIGIRGAAILTAMLLTMSLTSCGETKGGEFAFNFKVKELKTNIQPSPFEAEVLISPKWGSGEGEVALNPNWRTVLGDTPVYPYLFCVNPDGQVVIDDLYNKRLVIYNSTGEYINAIGYSEIGNKKSHPSRIAASKNVIYCTYNDGNVVSFDFNGKVLGDWYCGEKPESWGESTWYEGNTPFVGPDGVFLMIGNRSAENNESYTTITKWDEKGNAISSFSFDVVDLGGSSIAIDGKGNFYRNGKGATINVYDSQGKYIHSIQVDNSGEAVSVLSIDREGCFYLLKTISYEDHILYKYNQDGKAVSSHQFNSDTGFNYFYYDTPSTINEGYLFLINKPSVQNIENESIEIYRVML